MALKPCYECGNEVSTLAAACPKCGAPNNKPSFKKLSKAAECAKTWSMVGSVVVVVLVICFTVIWAQSVKKRDDSGLSRICVLTLIC
jgi:hypothetical protein